MNDSPVTPPDDSQNLRLQKTMSWVLVVALTIFGLSVLYKLTQFHKTEGDYWK